MNAIEIISAPVFWVAAAQFASVDPLLQWTRRIHPRATTSAAAVQGLLAVVIALAVFVVPLWALDEFPLSASSVRPYFFGALVAGVPSAVVARLRRRRVSGHDAS